MVMRLLTIVPLVSFGIALSTPTLAQSIDDWCVPGAAIDVYANGSWVPSTVRGYPDADGLCPIMCDGFSATYDESVGADRAGPQGEGRSFASPATTKRNPMVPDASAQPMLADYHCVAFTNGRLYNRPGFILQADGQYVHDYGTTGTYEVSGGVVEFSDGDMDGMAGVVQGDLVRMYNEARTGLVMDCEAR